MPDNLPAPTPNLSQSLGPHALDKHRAMIGLEVSVIMSGYWKDFPSQVILDGIQRDWMDSLQDWHVDQVKAAMIEWRNQNPSKRPNPGHILQILKRRRGKVYAQRSAEADPLFDLSRSVAEAVDAKSASQMIGGDL